MGKSASLSIKILGDIMIERQLGDKRMSRIVTYNETVYLAGIVSDDKTLDIKGQTKRALKTVDERLKLANSDKNHILMIQAFIKDIYRDFSDFNEIWDAWVSKENPPARACIEANMANKETLLVLVITAIKKD